MMKYLVILVLALLAVSNAQSNLECEFCDFIVGYAEKYVEQGKSEAYIISEMEKVCKFSGPLVNTCDSLISTYGDDIIQMLVNKEDAAVICDQVKLCTNSSQVETIVDGTVECNICIFAAGKIETYLKQNATEKDIVNFLDTDCKIFGGLSSTCESLVNSYVPELVTLVESNETPAEVCEQVTLCSGSSEKQVAPAKKQPKQNNVSGFWECEICDILVKEVEAYVQNKSTEAQIVAALNKQCALLPETFLQDICTSTVSQYADVIIQYVFAQESASTICGQIGMCGSSSESSKSSSQSSQSSSESSESSESSSQSGSVSGSATGSMSGSSQNTGTSGSMRIYVQ